MKNILIIEGGKYIGGGQIMTLNIGEMLSDDYNVIIAVPDNNLEIIKLLNKFRLVKYTSMNIKNGKKTFIDFINYLIQCFRFLPKMYSACKNNHIDLIYVQSQKMSPIAVVLGMLIDKPVLVHLHVYHTDAKSRRILNLCLRVKCVKKIIGVSKHTISQLSASNIKKSKVIYNFIDLSSRSNNVNIANKLNKNNFNIAIIANILPDKGQFIGIKAINVLKKYKVNLYILGSIRDTEYYNELVKFIKNNELEDRVIFTGQVPNVDEILNNINLVLILSTLPFETFSLSMVEAWSKGIPTISSNLGGMRELVNDFIPQYRDKMLFESGNVDELVKKCLYFIDNNGRNEQMTADLKLICNQVFSKNIFKKCIKESLDDVFNPN